MQLGLDVGDLDRVVQIDAPGTVSSFLQRMGRTGRRSEMIRNCLFLATSDEGLLRGAALIELWQREYVESVQAPPYPYHILAQQLMALILQERGIGKSQWFPWVESVPSFAEMTPERVAELVEFWTKVLGVGVKADYGEFVWLDPLAEGGPSLAFQLVPEQKSTKNRLHLDLEVDDRVPFIGYVESLGGSKLDEHTSGTFTWNVMADPAGNEFCIAAHE